MRDPGAIVPISSLAALVGTDATQRFLVGLWIILDRDLSSHPTYCRSKTAVAGFDGMQGIGAHEVRGHGDLCAVGIDELWQVAELFDGAEDIVPAATIESGGVIAQFVENLIHFEGGKDGFD